MHTSKPLTARVYTETYSAVINGEYTSEDIITESMLIEKFGVSKSPVREALIQLCNEDILRAIPRLGYMVVQITPREIRELAEARLALEMYLLEKSFTLFTEEALEELDELNHSNREEGRIKSTPMDNWQRNMAFHLKLASYAQNNVMYDLLRQVLRKLTRATTQHFSGLDSGNPLMKERASGSRHFELVNACKDRDLVYAKRVLEIDINALKY